MPAYPWLLFCMTLLSFPGEKAIQKINAPESLYSWIKVIPPKPGSQELDDAARSEYEWQVEMKGDKPTAHRRNVKAEEANALPPLIKRTRGPHPEPGEIHSVQVTDGWLISFNAGESGGGIWWYGNDGRQSYKVSNDQVVQFLPAKRGLFALEGVEHFNSERGQILQIQQNNQGQWMTSTFYNLGHAPDVGMILTGGDFLVSTNQTLVRVHPDKTETVLIPKVFWTGLAPRSIAISSAGDIYLGMHQGVSIVYPLKQGFGADWLIPSKEILLTRPKN